MNRNPLSSIIRVFLIVVAILIFTKVARSILLLICSIGGISSAASSKFPLQSIGVHSTEVRKHVDGRLDLHQRWTPLEGLTNGTHNVRAAGGNIGRLRPLPTKQPLVQALLQFTQLLLNGIFQPQLNVFQQSLLTSHVIDRVNNLGLQLQDLLPVGILVLTLHAFDEVLPLDCKLVVPRHTFELEEQGEDLLQLPKSFLLFILLLALIFEALGRVVVHALDRLANGRTVVCLGNRELRLSDVS
mmetsp:Transcript_72390/g.172504  ORF Transcript_72390/g.172504 Transcript_72390/m.172504 type:complete len:243 (-) Transcript_72390:320-1048(-)